MTAAAKVTDINTWQCPDGRLILPVSKERTPEWYAARQQGIGGSDLAAIRGEGYFSNSTAYDVWLSKLYGSELEESDAMHYGSVFEDAIARDWAAQMGLTVRNVGTYQSLTYPHVIANPDRLVSDGSGLEVKTANAFTKAWRDGATPLQYVRQAELCLLATGRKFWWIVCVIGGQHLEVRRVERNEELLREHGEFVEAWWARHVVGKERPDQGAPVQLPDIDPDLIAEAVLPDLVLEDEVRWREINREIKSLTAERDQIKERMGVALGTSKVLVVNGRPVVKWIVRRGKRSFATKKFVSDHPDLDEKYSTRGEETRYPALIGDDDE